MPKIVDWHGAQTVNMSHTMSVYERDALRILAAQNRMSVSAYVRSLLYASAPIRGLAEKLEAQDKER